MNPSEQTSAYPDPSFFQRLRKASRRLLLLDFDGTLSPFVENRFEAYPYPGVTEILKNIMVCPKGKMIIITGRPVAEILPLLNMSPSPEIWGAHGWERLTADGKIETFPLPGLTGDILKKVRTQLEAKIPAEKLDVKSASIAVHWRGLGGDVKAAYQDHAQQVCAPYDDDEYLELQGFDGGLELRVKGRDKGTSVKAILKEAPSETMAVYLGDDRTDEDAFEALQGIGTGILVRREWRETKAQFRLKPPEDLLAFLDQWQQACR